MPLGLIIALAVSGLLLYVESSNPICFGPLLIAVAAYMIPRLFGMRDVKRLLIWGFLLLFLLSAVGMVISQDYMENDDTRFVSSPEGGLVDANVSPYLPGSVGPYTFEVTVTLTQGVDFEGIFLDLWKMDSIYLGYPMTGAAPTQHPMHDSGGGVWSVVLDSEHIEADNNYYFRVQAIADGDVVKEMTEVSVHPALRGDDPSFYFFGNLYYLSLNVGLPFFLLTFFSWWIRRNMDRTIERMREEGRIPPMETECEQCGFMNPTALKSCRQCGGPMPGLETVIAPPVEPKEPEATYVCSECGADVGEEDEFCPKCGESFED